MTSLKSFCELLSPYVGVTPSGLYERQRLLAKIGALPKPTRGRGHGLLATPGTVAPLLVALMATDTLANIDRGFTALSTARCADGCRLTHQYKFIDAMSALIGSPSLASRVIRLQVSRVDQAAFILFPNPTKQDRSLFGNLRDFPDQMDVDAVFYGHVLQKIATLLQSAMEDQ